MNSMAGPETSVDAVHDNMRIISSRRRPQPPVPVIKPEFIPKLNVPKIDGDEDKLNVG